MRRTGKAIGTLAAATSLAMLGGGLAVADTLQDTIADTGTGVTLVAGSTTAGTASIRVVGNNAAGDPDPGCNIDAGDAPLKLDIVTPEGVTANPDPLIITSCGDDFAVSFTASATAVSGKATVSVISGPAGGGTYVNQVDIPITITSAKTAQSINFDQPTTPRQYGDTFAVAPTASSDLPVAVAAAGSCTIEGGDVTMTMSTGDCVLTASQVGSATYLAADPVTRVVGAVVRELGLTAEVKSKTYGDADPALTYQVTSGSLVGSDALTGSLSRVAGENAGTYAIQQNTLSAGNNYDLSYTGADLTIGQRALTVTADPASKTYGDADPALTYQVTSGSLVGSDALTGSLSRVAGENAGTYAIQQNTLSAGNNYDLSYTGADLTIGQRALTVTADPASKTYGDADPALTYQVTSGSLVGSDALTGSLSRVAGENAGTYAIQQNTLSAGNNYDLSYTGADLTIGQRALTVTADPASKTYGDADPALTYQVTSGSLVGSDALTGSLSRVAGENAGTYAIQQNTLSAGNNYNLSFVSAKLTIIGWTMKGFYQPVDMGSTPNSVKGGSTVPMKFEVFSGNTELTTIGAVKSFKAQQVSCQTMGGIADEIEVVSTGGTSLRYDSTAGQFIQNWKTPTGSNTCYVATLTTQDGSTIVANFKLK